MKKKNSKTKNKAKRALFASLISNMSAAAIRDKSYVAKNVRNNTRAWIPARIAPRSFGK